MGHIPFFTLTIMLGATLCQSFEESPSQQNTTQNLTTIQYSNSTYRQSRHLHEVIELPPPGKITKRQIIKIPPNVSTVKLVQPPLNLRHNKGPQQFSRYGFRVKAGKPQQRKSQNDWNTHFEQFDPKKTKRNLKRPVPREVTRAELFKNEDFNVDFNEEKDEQTQLRKQRPIKKVVKIKRKKPKQNILGEYLINYENDALVNQKEGGETDSSKVHYSTTDDSQSFHGYEVAGSNIHMKQVAPPNLFPYNVQTADFTDSNYVPGFNINKLPTKGRQLQSLFSQQYTTHNPYVTTNFGLNEYLHPNGIQYGAKPFVESSPFSTLNKHNTLVGAASDQIVTAVPLKTPGIQVIQPPQFRDVTVSHPSHPSRLISSLSHLQDQTSSQKATIRDILEQDCPSFDAKGYCDSPPRYPMQQIKNMIKKCSAFMEIMNTQPLEEPYEVYGFSKRSDDREEKSNTSLTTGSAEQESTWSRSANEGHTACTSDLEFTEPGYAKEVNSGRWFVIVQHPDTTIQRIAIDICRNPSKTCGGLSELKCSKINNLPSKSTKCVQRYTYQRLISWDPESPEDCPRMRVFRFPSACVCHLGVV